MVGGKERAGDEATREGKMEMDGKRSGNRKRRGAEQIVRSPWLLVLVEDGAKWKPGGITVR